MFHRLLAGLKGYNEKLVFRKREALWAYYYYYQHETIYVPFGAKQRLISL